MKASSVEVSKTNHLIAKKHYNHVLVETKNKANENYTVTSLTKNKVNWQVDRNELKFTKILDRTPIGEDFYIFF